MIVSLLCFFFFFKRAYSSRTINQLPKNWRSSLGKIADFFLVRNRKREATARVIKIRKFTHQFAGALCTTTTIRYVVKHFPSFPNFCLYFFFFFLFFVFYYYDCHYNQHNHRETNVIKREEEKEEKRQRPTSFSGALVVIISSMLLFLHFTRWLYEPIPSSNERRKGNKETHCSTLVTFFFHFGKQ